MSALVEPTEVLSFDGVVECCRRAGTIALQLRGAQRETQHEGQHGAQRQTGGVTELLFAGVREPLPELPAQLNEVRVLQLQMPPPPTAMSGSGQATAATAYRIQAREGHFELRARSVQLHHETAAVFFRAVPPPPVPRATRLGWTLLLGMLRLPGAARLLGR